MVSQNSLSHTPFEKIAYKIDLDILYWFKGNKPSATLHKADLDTIFIGL